jgi:hypothetical protein
MLYCQFGNEQNQRRADEITYIKCNFVQRSDRSRKARARFDVMGSCDFARRKFTPSGESVRAAHRGSAHLAAVWLFATICEEICWALIRELLDRESAWKTGVTSGTERLKGR